MNVRRKASNLVFYRTIKLCAPEIMKALPRKNTTQIAYILSEDREYYGKDQIAIFISEYILEL